MCRTVSAPTTKGGLGHLCAAEAFMPQRALPCWAAPFASYTLGRETLPAEPGFLQGVGLFLCLY